MAKFQRLNHGFGPFIPSNPKYLFLGTFPSVKSREQQFYYGHPQNHFWRLLADIFESDVPSTLDEKKAFLEKHSIAVYDVIESCDIVGSSDSSIKNVVPTNIEEIVKEHGIDKIIVNGRLAEKLFRKHHPNLTAYYVPSSSPANAAISFEKKLEQWKDVICSDNGLGGVNES